jgi:YteA family regulatory protein
MNVLTREQEMKLRKELERERTRLAAALEDNGHFGLSSALREQTGDLSVNDNHPGDLGTELFERGKDIALNENVEKRLEAIIAALSAMDAGDYGICRACGKPIPPERLFALPTALYCAAHSPHRRDNNRRPREEGLMAPPFGRTSLDELDGQNEFDGEDAWQIVESWGNSNSPAMAENPNVDDYDTMYVEAEESEGYVEPIENFLATDLYGKDVTFVRSREYREYMARGEGVPLLEPDPVYDPDASDAPPVDDGQG